MTERTLSDAAEYFYAVCELWEDEDLDPDDSLEVLKRAFRSSDCDDFAAVLARMTGWDVATMTWEIPGHGFGHHALVRSPDGRLLDVGGWTDEAELRQVFGIRKQTRVGWSEGHMSAPIYGDDDEAVELIETTIVSLPHAPFSTPEFQSHIAPAATLEP